MFYYKKSISTTIVVHDMKNIGCGTKSSDIKCERVRCHRFSHQ